MKVKLFRQRALVGIAGIVVAAVLVAPAALARPATKPMVIGNATKGKTLFSTNCAACHTLKAAGAKGTIGPNLNTLVLAEATIIKQITDGGASLVGKPIQGKTYQTAMTAFKGVLSTAEIEDIAAFVYNSTHK